MLRRSRATRALTQAAAALAVLLVPAAAQAAYAVPTSPCPATPSAGTVFAAWRDNAQYVPVAGGTFDGRPTGWSLSGGAAVVSGGSPFWGGSHSLGLPTGASATSASICIGAGYPVFRFTARNTGAATSTLQVEALYLDGTKNPSKVVGQLSDGLVERDAAPLGRPRSDRGQRDRRPDSGGLPLHAARRRRPLADRRPLRRPIPARLSDLRGARVSRAPRRSVDARRRQLAPLDRDDMRRLAGADPGDASHRTRPIVLPPCSPSSGKRATRRPYDEPDRREFRRATTSPHTHRGLPRASRRARGERRHPHRPRRASVGARGARLVGVAGPLLARDLVALTRTRAG